LKKARYIIGLAGLAPVAVGLMTPAAANGASAHRPIDRGESLSAKRVNPHSHKTRAARAPEYWWEIYKGPATLWYHDGGHQQLFNGSEVLVTCYYSGAPWASDPYWDHVIEEQSKLGHVTSHYSGHVADHYADLGGQYPYSYISHC
jgi:hypothetical protein